MMSDTNSDYSLEKALGTVEMDIGTLKRENDNKININKTVLITI